MHIRSPQAERRLRSHDLFLQAMRLACLLLGLWGFVGSARAADAPSSPPRPNIVFVLIDDFGYADSGPYGAKDIRTPNMDRLAREGMRFTDFYSNAPVCTPTRCGFITGRWQQRVGFEWAMGFTAESFRRIDGRLVPEKEIHALGLPTSVPTLPKWLKAAGYATGAFGKWHLGYKD
ncbi:MAG: sulfatase-like hydrolase/transferase, partial [Planctomycetaceae bacterium]|nr:sulfatase-like hydrolase/transferase [Planctomycetaceae bacterium]